MALCVLRVELCASTQVASANRHGSLLDVVQVLTDLNLSISRAYISSDGEWFMDGNFSIPLCYMVFLNHLSP